MTPKVPLPSVDRKASSTCPQEGDLLTEAQREFAKMLGPLLARRWLQLDLPKETASGKQPPTSAKPI